jgi:DNA-binding NarL/FixJ family response regulator
VLIIENRQILRLATKALLDSSGDFQVVADVENWGKALLVFSAANADVILLGAEAGGLGALDTAGQVLQEIPEARIVMLFLREGEGAAAEALRLGVRGIIDQTSSVANLCDALATVARGEIYYRGDLEHVIRYLSHPSEKQRQRLAPREMRVLQLIAQGKTSKEIAGFMGVTVETARHYRKSIMRKLNAHNVASLLMVASSEGLIFGDSKKAGQ